MPVPGGHAPFFFRAHKAVASLPKLGERVLFVVDSAPLFETWLRFAPGQRTMGMDEDSIVKVMDVVGVVGMRVPVVRFYDELYLDGNGSAPVQAMQMGVDAHLDWDGFLRVELAVIAASFKPRWCNPLWLADVTGHRDDVWGVARHAINNTAFPAPVPNGGTGAGRATAPKAFPVPVLL